jgi:hypothetical protein
MEAVFLLLIVPHPLNYLTLKFSLYIFYLGLVISKLAEAKEGFHLIDLKENY